jgi:hypothetical protein
VEDLPTWQHIIPNFKDMILFYSSLNQTNNGNIQPREHLFNLLLLQGFIKTPDVPY